MILAAAIATIVGGVLALAAVFYKISVWTANVDRTIQKELTHNGGSSMKDASRRIEDSLLVLQTRQDETDKRIDRLADAVLKVVEKK